MSVPIDNLIVAILQYVGLSLAHGTVLAIITWLVSVTLLRRSRPAIHAFLWTIVLIKFFVPPILPGEMALSGLVSNTVTRIVATQTARIEPAHIPVNGPRPAAEPDQATESRILLLMRSLVFCYLVLVVILAARTLRAFRRTKRVLRDLRMAPGIVREEVADLALRVGLKHIPETRIIDGDTTPYVFGLRRSVLVLPERLLEMRQVPERQSLILHELAHIRRKDVAVRYVQCAATVFYFFFPPVIWVCRRVEHFSELACDHWAMAISEIEPAIYAGALVRVIREMSEPLRPGTRLALIGRVRFIERRIRAIFDRHVSQPPRLSFQLKLTLAFWCVFAFLGGSTARVSQQPVLTSPEVEGSEAANYQDDARSAPPEARRRADTEDKVRTNSPSPRKIAADQADERLPESEVNESNTQNTKNDSARTPSLSDFEIGYMLGRKYAQELAKRSVDQRELRDTPQVNADLRNAESKRAIELRMQSLAKQLPRQ